MRTRISILLLAAMFLAPAVAVADAMADLQKRFKERYPRLVELKQAGTVGEAAAGFVDYVKGAAPDPQTKQFVDAENADRTELYKLIADKEKTTPEKVAQLNGARNFAKARDGEWLKSADGQWKQKGK